MNRYRILVHWTHHKWGPQTERLAAEGSSIRRALSSALLSFFSDRSSRSNRRDAHVHLRAEIWRLKKDTAFPRRKASSRASAATAK
jgi:hypothetical protein